MSAWKLILVVICGIIAASLIGFAVKLYVLGSILKSATEKIKEVTPHTPVIRVSPPAYYSGQEKNQIQAQVQAQEIYLDKQKKKLPHAEVNGIVFNVDENGRYRPLHGK